MTAPRRRGIVALAVAVGLATGPVRAASQFDAPPPPAAYALSGVTQVLPDGTTRPGLTIVVRGGVIEAIGTAVAIPADAELLEGDSLMVYPGLIDAHGGAAAELPEPEVDRSELEAWDPPRDVQGFMPARRLADFLTATGADLKDARGDGVVAAAVHPSGPVMPGRGAVLALRPDARTPRELVLQDAIGPVFTFRGARGVYPGTLFGVPAFIRQSFEDARHDGLVREAYRRDPRGLPLPTWDPDYEVLRQVLAGTLPVYFLADEAADIRLALSLAGEYGFRPVIVGGGEAWRVARRLSEQRIPVLVSLDFPAPERWDPDAEPPEGEEAEPLDAAALREKQDLENRYANAGRLAAAGVQFALTSGGGEADLREGVAKVISYGLDEPQALAAVTTTPASLLGLEPLLRVEVGMPATFVVTDGPIFEEGTAVRYTFVAGGLERGRPSRAAASGEEPAVDMTGEWSVSISAEGQAMSGILSVEQEGAEFTGSMRSDMGTARVEGGVVSGTDVSFTLVFSMGGETMEFEVSGTVEGDEASGRGSGAMGSFTWTARRNPGSDAEVRS